MKPYPPFIIALLLSGLAAAGYVVTDMLTGVLMASAVFLVLALSSFAGAFLIYKVMISGSGSTDPRWVAVELALLIAGLLFIVLSVLSLTSYYAAGKEVFLGG